MSSKTLVRWKILIKQVTSIQNRAARFVSAGKLQQENSVTAIKENVNGEILSTIPNKTEQIINPHTSIIVISVHNPEKGTWEINLEFLTTAVFSPIKANKQTDPFFWFLHWHFYDRRMYLYQSHQWTWILCLSATSIQDKRTFKSAVIYHQGRKVL